MDRNVAALRIAREVASLENALNVALASASSLTTSIAVGRQIDGIDFASGQDALVRLAAVQQLLTKSATETIRVHRDLRRTHAEITGVADSNGDCPPLTSPTGINLAA